MQRDHHNNMSCIGQLEQWQFRSNHECFIFGVTEDKNSSVWHAKVAAALQHIAGRPADITDAFRIGKFDLNQPRPRPIIGKLRCVWDKRLILSLKLAEVSEFRHMGVVSDEPLEVRRKIHWNVCMTRLYERERIWKCYKCFVYWRQSCAFSNRWFNTQ